MAVDREFVYIVCPGLRPGPGPGTAMWHPGTIGDLLKTYLNLGTDFPSKRGQFAERVIKNGASQDTQADQADQADLPDLPDLPEMGHGRQFGP